MLGIKEEKDTKEGVQDDREFLKALLIQFEYLVRIYSNPDLLDRPVPDNLDGNISALLQDYNEDEILY